MLSLAAVAGLTGVGGSEPAGAKDKPEPVIDYGPPPTWARYRELGEAAVIARLIDPDSAKITWPFGYKKGGATPQFSRRIYGYSTCGMVNSHNRFGGYTGPSPFAIVIDHDAVQYIEFGHPGDDIDTACSKAGFPSVDDMPGATTVVGTRPGFGFTYNVVGKGASIMTVVPASPAAQAGLRPGLVIAKMNGVTLSGLGADIINGILAARSVADITLTDGTVMSLTKADITPSAGSATQ